jgi:predicted RNase H-like nuclease (RuvC/YqgF family)
MEKQNEHKHDQEHEHEKVHKLEQEAEKLNREAHKLEHEAEELEKDAHKLEHKAEELKEEAEKLEHDSHGQGHGREHGQDHEHEREHDDIVKITINGTKYDIHRGKHTVVELKALAHIAAADEFNQVINGILTPLPNDGVVDINGGELFASNVPSGGSSWR